MRTNIYATAVALSDRDLLARLDGLAAAEREATAEMLAHLAALELRPSLYLARGYGSLFEYCTRALHLTEDAACTRTKVVRVCQEFPSILDLLFAGTLSMTAVRLLGPHLTAANQHAVLARAANKGRGDIELLVAEIAPRPDVPASVRKVPAPRTESVVPGQPASQSLLSEATASPSPASSTTNRDAQEAPPTLAPTFPTSEARPIIQPLAPKRYRVQFTIGQETHDRLRRVQSLVRREVPSGDVAAIFDRALQLLEQAARSKLGFLKPSSRARARARVTSRPTPDTATGTYESRIRFETDRPSRHIPNAIKRAVWHRDQGQCAFVGTTGHRCAERGFLEFHHIQPFASGGSATVGNISLRCRRHNAFEAELVFGPRGPSSVSEMREVYQAGVVYGRFSKPHERRRQRPPPRCPEPSSRRDTLTGRRRSGAPLRAEPQIRSALRDDASRRLPSGPPGGG